MADTYTIQFRRGMYADFDTSKIRPGEPVAILGNDPSVPSGKALYIAFAPNDVRRLCSIEDISEMVNAGKFVGPQGPKGEKGDKGDPGEKGADGTVAFESLTPEQKESLRGISIESASVDADGNLTITFSDGDSEDVGNIMGPQGIQGSKGDKGVGVKKITDYYALSSSNTDKAFGQVWLTTPPTMTAEKKYLWHWQRTDCTDGSFYSTEKGVIGVYGEQGPKGDKGDVGPKGDNMSDEQAAQIEQNKKDVASLKEDLDNIENVIYEKEIPIIDWVIGGITSQGSINSSFTYSIRPKKYAYLLEHDGYVYADDGYQVKVVVYSNSIMGASVFVSSSGWTSERVKVEAGSYIAPCIREGNDSSIEQTDTHISEHVRYDIISSNLKDDVDKLKDKIFPVISPFYRNIDANKEDYSEWYTPTDDFTDDGFNRDTMYATIIEKFDSLVSDGNGYVTKTALGTTSGYTVYEYAFTPSKVNNVYATKETPKILLGCAAHGFEKNSTYATYYFLKDLVNNYKDKSSIRHVRENVEIRVIPVVNPWGFDRNNRLNENNVNINRNYDVPNWIVHGEGTANYSGTAPFSESESQIVRDWVNQNEDAIIFLDVHTNGQYNVNGYHEMNALMPVRGTNDDYYNKIYHACENIINEQTIMLPRTYDVLSPSYGSFIGRIQDEPIDLTDGHANLWGTVRKNIVSMTFELFNGVVVDGVTIVPKFEHDSLAIATTILGNGIIKFIKEFAE